MQPHLRFAVGKGQGAMWLGCPPMVVCGRPTFKVNHLHAMHKELCALASARPQTALPYNYEDSTIMLARHRDKLLPVLRINSDRLVQDCLPNCTEDIRTSLLNNRAHIKTNYKVPSSLIPSLFAFADEAFPKSSDTRKGKRKQDAEELQEEVSSPSKQSRKSRSDRSGREPERSNKVGKESKEQRAAGNILEGEMREIGSRSNLVCNASLECLPPKLACRCENTVNSTNTAFHVRGCEYAVTSSWAENVKAFTFIHYRFNYKPGDRCKTVADMLVDINFAAFAVKVLLTDSHRALAPMRQGDDTFVSFNLGAWETKNAKERFVECHGHAQWNVEVGYDNFEQDLQSLFRSFGVEWVTQSIVD